MTIKIHDKYQENSTGTIVTIQRTEKRGRWTIIHTEEGEMEEGKFLKTYSLITGASKEEATKSLPPRVRQDNGDVVAEALRAASIVEEIWSVPMVLEHLDVAAIKARYGHLSPGLVRMNVGNQLRKALEKKERETE